VSWTGSDAIGELASYSVFVSVDGGVFSPVVEGTLETTATLSGDSGTQYGFFCAAKDTAGNVENQALVAETTTTTCLDTDGDRFCAGGDCSEGDPYTHQNAVEINDGLDNQCEGDSGYGVADELSGATGFFNPSDKNELSWPAQTGATIYETARSTAVDFSVTCVLFSTVGTTWSDGSTPTSGQVFYYLARAAAPNAGSWGQESSGNERTVNCPALLW
jgi:hypothetical protein